MEGMPFEVIRVFNEYGPMILSGAGVIIVGAVGYLVSHWKKEGNKRTPLDWLCVCGSVALALFMVWYVSVAVQDAFHIEDALFPDDYPAFYRDSYYVGQVKNGQAIGEGKLFDAESSRLVYSGTFKDNRISEGTFYYESGERYAGEFQNDQKNGQGTCYWTRESRYDRYEGTWQNGKINGQGVMYYSDRDESERNRYEGEWLDNMIEGHGTMYWKDGSWYDGAWSGGKRNGQGNYHYANGGRYYGEWKDGQRVGYGVDYYTNGTRYEGQFVNGKRGGSGVYYYLNGDRYEGEWADDKREGHGVFYWANGARYEGEWADDKRNGAGTYYYADGRSEEQEYQNGERIDDAS